MCKSNHLLHEGNTLSRTLTQSLLKAPLLVFLPSVLVALLHALPATAGQERHNILLVVADDFATDGMRLYNSLTNGVSFPPLPTVERLAKSGLTFLNAYSYPTCSPARCTILTGRYGFRTGIGYALANPLGPALRTNEFTIPKAMAAADPARSHGLVGKWHLSFGATDPNEIGGFKHFSGGILGELEEYDAWPVKVTNGVQLGSQVRPFTNYATTDNLKDATNWIGAQTNNWFLWLAFNACHEPLHPPPANLHTYTNLPGTSEDITNHPRPYYEAMAQSLDTTLSNLLAFLGPQTNQTTVIFLGDNGTPWKNIQAPYTTNQCKGTLYEGGIRIPLMIAGPKVAGANRTTEALVSTVDLYATILELAGIDLTATLPANLVFDSQSLMPIIANPGYVPPERCILAENFSGNLSADVAGRAVRNGRYKLILFSSGAQEMYDLKADPYEHANLLKGRLDIEGQANYRLLLNKMDEWQEIPQPVVASYVMANERFGVTANRSSGARCWLWRNDSVDYPVWTVLTNVTSVPVSSTALRILDLQPPTRQAFYRLSLQAVQSSTNTAVDWRDWD